MKLGLGMKTLNPVDEKAQRRKYTLTGSDIRDWGRINVSQVADAILKGKKGGYPFDYKMLFILNSNYLTQTPDINKTIKAFNKMEFIVVEEQFMTPTAKFADILLPVNTFMERSDIAPPWLGSPYYIYLNKAVETMYEAKSDLDICRDLAPRLGLDIGLFGMDQDDILRNIGAGRDDIPDFDAMKRDGVLKIKLDEPIVSFKEQIEDPENNPFPTLSGKIEIHCDHIAELDQPNMPAIPKYIPGEESYDAPKSKDFPLQLLTTHHKTRAHSTWHNVPWMREHEPHGVWINPSDASDRGIGQGDLVDVFNDNGRMRIPARVTGRIMPGVVNVSQGAWYDPDENGIDRGGCANVLTHDDRSPGGAIPMNSSLVEVERASAEV